jgi:hypothetical protein
MRFHLVSSFIDLGSSIAALDEILRELSETGDRKADSFFGMGPEPVRRDGGDVAELDPSLAPDVFWESLGDGPWQGFGREQTNQPMHRSG